MPYSFMHMIKNSHYFYSTYSDFGTGIDNYQICAHEVAKYLGNTCVFIKVFKGWGTFVEDTFVECTFVEWNIGRM